MQSGIYKPKLWTLTIGIYFDHCNFTKYMWPSMTKPVMWDFSRKSRSRYIWVVLHLLQIWDRSPVPFPRYSALCTPLRELLNSRNYVQMHCCARACGLRILRVNENWFWAGPLNLTKRVNKSRRERHGYDLRLRLSADRSKRTSYQPLYSTNSPLLDRSNGLRGLAAAGSGRLEWLQRSA